MRLGLGWLAVTLMAGVSPAQSEFFLKDGDRAIVCGGTLESQLALLDRLESFVATRFPDMRVAFAPAARLGRDLLVFRPTVLAVLPGALDSGALQQLRAAAPGIRVTILQPGSDPAQGLLEAWHAPATVAEVEVDALLNSAPLALNATVRELAADRYIFWSQDDRALPMAAHSGLPAALNRQVMRVRGLTGNRYRLTIDGQPFGAFWREQYEAGIDLAPLPTPMALQAGKLRPILDEYAGIHLARWLGWQSPECGTPQWAARMTALDEGEAVLLERLRTAAHPATHDFELQPQQDGLPAVPSGLNDAAPDGVAH